MNQGKRDYYEIGNSMEDLHVSSSSLKYINPEEGGSPLLFKDFIEGGQDISHKPSIILGRNIHAWHEDKDSFKIASVPKPSEKLGLIADRVIELCQQGNEASSDTYFQVIQEQNYYANRWGDKVVGKLIADTMDACDAYVYEYLEAKEEGLVFLTEAQAETVRNGCEAIQNHPAANQLLFPECDFSDKLHIKEAEIFLPYTDEVKVKGASMPFQLWLKSKIDSITIDFEKRVINIIDLKSSGKPVHNYGNSFRAWRIYRQLAFYYNMVKRSGLQLSSSLSAVYNERMIEALESFEYRFYIVAIETSKLQQCVVHEVDRLWIDEGNVELNTLLKRIGYHSITKNWSYSIEEVKNNYILPLVYEAKDK
jgi:hypothetical protein